MAADTGEGLRKLLDWVKPTGPLSIQQRANQTRDALERLLEQRKTSAKALNDAEMEWTRSQQEMEKVPIEQIALLGKRLNDLQSEIQSQGRRIRTIADTLRGTEFSAKRLKEEEDELSAVAGIDQDAFNQLNRAKDRVEKLLKAVKIYVVKMNGLRLRSPFPEGCSVVWVEGNEVSR